MSHKPLRFAALIRVSTEKQERQGESLSTQATQIKQAVESLNGQVVAHYAGQEHATEGWERKQLNRLLADAKKIPKPFDAVMVADLSRWSRDSAANESDLNALCELRIRFFVLTNEYNLFDPQDRFVLGMTTHIGAFNAGVQNQRSIENRIERAKRGVPTSGKLPYGRTFDRTTKTWGVDAAKRELIANAARRYLAGEPMPVLAKELGMNHTNLHKILTKRCGPTWTVEFNAPKLNISQSVDMLIPELLPESTIRRILARAEANKTYRHGTPKKNRFLFSGMVFCGYCGYLLFGQSNKDGHLYYRHSNKERCRDCPRKPRPYVRADYLEDLVIRHLFDTFGNPDAAKRAIEQAIPDNEKVEEYRKRHVELEQEFEKIKKVRHRILKQIENDAVTDADADSSFHSLKNRESAAHAERARLEEALSNSPSEIDIKAMIETIQRRLARGLPARPVSAKRWIAMRDAKMNFAAMTWEEKRSLAEMVFDGKTPDGKPRGIYVTAVDGQECRRQKKWRYEVQGLAPLDGEFAVQQYEPDEEDEEKAVTQSASSVLKYSP